MVSHQHVTPAKAGVHEVEVAQPLLSWHESGEGLQQFPRYGFGYSQPPLRFGCGTESL